MKNILYVHQVSSIGGASYCLLSLIKALDRSKYKPSVLLKTDGPLVKQLKALDVDIYMLPQLSAIPYNKSLYNWKTILGYWHVHQCRKSFRKFINEHDFDLVYLNNMMLYPYLKDISGKSIIHVREHWPLEEHKKQLARAKRYLEKYATRVVAINHYSASIFSECADKTDIVYDWIDMSCRHKEVSFNDIFGEDVTDKKVYLFTGGSNWTKGPRTVIETFIKEMKGDDKRLLVLGIKPLPQYSFAKRMLKNIFDFFGRKDSNKELHKMLHSDSRIKCISSFYEIADIIEKAYCNLSYFAIPHANLALAESIIMKTPCIAARTSESLEYSKEGKLAILFELGNKSAYQHAIKELDMQYELLKSRLEKDSHEVAEMFDSNINIERINRVYSVIFD